MERPRVAIHSLPASFDPWLAAIEQGRLLWHAGDLGGADLAFARACDLRPDRPDAFLERAHLWWLQGDVEQAEEMLRGIVRCHPGDATCAVLLARLLAQRDEVAQAMEVIATAAQNCPGHPLLLLAEGEVQLHRRAFAQALAFFEQAAQAGASPGAVRACLSRAELALGDQLTGRGHLHEAAFRYLRAASLDPSWAEPRSQLALVLSRLGNPRRAAQLLGQAAQLAPLSAEVHYRLGEILRDLGNVEGAGEAFERALRCDPLHLLARRALADLLAVQQPARALLLYAEEVARSPSDSRLWSSLGEVCLRCGDRRQAARCFRESLRLDQGDLRAITLLPLAEKRMRRRNTRDAEVSKQT